MFQLNAPFLYYIYHIYNIPAHKERSVKCLNSFAVWLLFYISHCWSNELHINSKNVFFFHTPSHMHEHPHMWFNVTLYEKGEILIIQGTDALCLPFIPIPLSSFTVVHYRIQIRIERGHNKQTQKKYKYTGSIVIKNKPLLKLKTKLWMEKACNMQDSSSKIFRFHSRMSSEDHDCIRLIQDIWMFVSIMLWPPYDCKMTSVAC